MTDVVVLEEQPAARPPRTPRVVTDVPTQADRVFDRVTLSAGIFVLVLLGCVGMFLLLRSRPAFDESGIFGFLSRSEWRTDVQPQRIGVLGLLFGTVVVATIAILIAVPLGVFTALFIQEYASPRVRRILSGLVDLLAAVPGLIFGLWGFLYVSPQLVPLSRWLTRNLGWIPIFKTDQNAALVNSMFIAGVVVSLMIVPIIAAVSREVFAQTPPGEKEAALALGSTRWGMIRTVVLPYGKGGIIGGSMLGFGRALGETIVVVLLLPQVPQITGHVLQNCCATISGFIAVRAGGDRFTVSGLMAAGLVLFLITLAVNMIASTIVSRSRSGSGVEL